MFKDKKIGVLMGGISNEREISLCTGKAVLSALQKRGYNACGIDVDQNIAQVLINEKIEVAFLALHGRFGEDGTIQGLLEIMQIPYTGSGVLASALAMDKIKSKELFIHHGLPTPRFVVSGLDAEPAYEKLTSLTWPLVVKDPMGGSTIDVYIVKDKEELQVSLDKLKGRVEVALIEEYILGKETTVCMLDGEVLGTIEIVPAENFYDYTAKYHSKGKTKYIIPPNLPEPQVRFQEEICLKAYKILGSSGQVRFDLRVDKDGNPFILEANTIPGMTETSLLPKAANYRGMSFEDLVIKILNGASLKLCPRKAEFKRLKT